jgi:serine/threonine protein kinase
MGEVWEAFDHSLNRLVAIKKLATSRAAEPGALDELIEEALNVAKLKHPNIVSIHFVFRGQQTGDVYLVFEHVGEGTVTNALEDGPLPPERAAGIVRGVAQALDYAHAQGVIHRDLKPSNILLERGTPKVADFGIAKLTEHQEGTMTARAAGTPAYMAPEQAMGVVSRQTDLYALGVTAFQMLTAQLPFPPSQPELKGTGLFVAATQRVPALPKSVDAFFTRALNPDPKLRFKDGQEFADAFERAVEAVTPLPRAV